KEVEQQQSDCALEIRRPKDGQKRLIPPCPPCPLWFKLLTLPCQPPMLPPHFRLRHTILYPKRDQRGQDSDKENVPPTGVAQDNSGHERRQREANRPRALHHRDGLGAQFIGPSFRDQSCSRIPFAAHPQP